MDNEQEFMEQIMNESAETLGLLYDRYQKLPETITKFMDKIESYYNAFPDDTDIDLDEELRKFKSDVEVKMNNPEPVDASEIKSTKTKVKTVKDKSEKILDRLGTFRRKMKAGDNWIKGILIKPKVLQNSVDVDKEQHVNKVIRIVSRSLDWVEKVTFDLMNFADQDLNLLSIVQKVYYRKFYEYVLDDDILDMYVEETEYEESYTDPDDLMNMYVEDAEQEVHDQDANLLDEPVESKNENEEYFPVFSIVTSYDFDQYKNATPEQKKGMNNGKNVRRVTLGDEFTHTLVSFDTSLEHMYHFIGQGFQHDSILTDPCLEVTKSIYINATFVTKEEKESIMQTLKEYDGNSDQTAYDLIQLINQLFGKCRHKEKRQICSTFVGYLLAKGNIKNIHRDYMMLRPEDVTILPRAFYVIQFKNKDDFLKRRDEFDERVKKIYDDNIDEIREYNNILPKIELKNTIDRFQKKGKIDEVFDYFIRKFT